MRVSSVPRLALALVALLARPAAGTAQTVFAECSPGELRRIDPASELRLLESFPDSAFLRVLPRLEALEYAQVADSIRRAFESDPADVPADMRSGFAGQIAETVRELIRAERAPDANVNRARFDIDLDPVDPERATYFPNQPYEVVITSELPVPARRAVCWRAMVLQRVLVTQGDPARRRALARLAEAKKHWENYGAKGQSQFPWELAINSIGFDATSLDPPRRQWIVLHPSLGLELAGPKASELRRLEVLVLEPVGIVQYTGSYNTYIGASAVVSFPDDAKPGVGALLHLGRLAKLGYIFRGRDEDGVRRNGILLNVDLYRLLSGPPEQIVEAAREAVRGEELEIAGAAP